MIYSKNLLAEFLPNITNISDDDLIMACGSIGTEIEKITKHPKLNDLVIGKLIEFSKHNDSVKLNVCKVKIDDYSDKILTIVCGAQNLVSGKKVIVALVGCKLHDGRVIEEREIRGVKSQGMLCGYYELTPNVENVSVYDSNGIILMDDGMVGDKDVAKHLGLDDTIYEIAVPFANRNDLNGVLSFCQELAGYFKWDFTYPTIKKMHHLTSSNINIKIDKNICSCFTFTKIKNIEYKESPWSLKSILMNNAITPINFLLDCLNYITLLTNVPSAAYDADLISDNVEICLAKKGEKFIGFNDKEYTLSENDIVVKSNDEIICLGGIIGAKKYGVTETTKNVWIEFADFDFKHIRLTATRLNITTDAAKRFSKEIMVFCSILSTQLLHTVFETNTLISETKIIYGNKKEIAPIKINYDLLRTMIGINISNRDVRRNLKWFGFKFTWNGKKAIPPPYRTEVLISQDIVEETVKALRVNELPETSADINIELEERIDDHYFNLHIKELMTENYFNEVKMLNTASQKELDNFNIFKYKNATKITSTHVESRQYLRTNLINSLLKVYEHNIAYKVSLLPIFEMQKIYADDKSFINLTGICEEQKHIDKIHHSSISYNVVGLKGLCNEIAKFFKTKFNYIQENTNNIEYFFNDEMLEIYYKNELVGYIGLIRNIKLPEKIANKKIYCFTINLEKMIKDYQTSDINFKHISNQMPIYKDVSILVDDYKVKINDILSNLIESNLAESFEIIDKFNTNDKISYTIRFKLNNNEGLQTKDIENILGKIISKLEENDKITVRK